MDHFYTVAVVYGEQLPVGARYYRLVQLDGDPLAGHRKKLQQMGQIDPFRNFMRLAVYQN